jgi:hypothetical protein
MDMAVAMAILIGLHVSHTLTKENLARAARGPRDMDMAAAMAITMSPNRSLDGMATLALVIGVGMGMVISKASS